MKKFALLFAGCVNERNNYPRYNNDLGYMYTVLQKYGYDRITVLYSDGRDVDYNQNKINTSKATRATFFHTLSMYQNLLEEDDLLLVMVSNHGGLNENDGTAYINGWGKHENILQNEFSAVLSEIKATKVVLLGQCFGGNILNETIPNSILISANIENVESYAAPSTKFEYDEFLYHFTSFYNESYPNGDPLTTSLHDKSIHAAYHYAKDNDYFRFPQVIQGENFQEIPQIKCCSCHAKSVFL